MSKTKRVNPSIDTAWFKDELEKRGYTYRFVAEKIGMGYPDFSRCVNGEAHFELQEVVDFAKLLNTPLLEVLTRVGVELPALGTISATAQLPVTGRVDAKGSVTAVEPGSKVSASTGVAVEALRVVPLPGLDTATLFLDKQREPVNCVGRLCRVELEAGHELRYVRRGSDEGLFTLISTSDPDDVATDVRLKWAQPVLWAKL